jgi:hypothetical protein
MTSRGEGIPGSFLFKIRTYSVVPDLSRVLPMVKTAGDIEHGHSHAQPVCPAARGKCRRPTPESAGLPPQMVQLSKAGPGG